MSLSGHCGVLNYERVKTHAGEVKMAYRFLSTFPSSTVSTRNVSSAKF